MWAIGKHSVRDTVKRSKLLDEMAREARTEVLRIEAARREAHRLLLRRKAELAHISTQKERKSSACSGLPVTTTPRQARLQGGNCSADFCLKARQGILG